MISHTMNVFLEVRIHAFVCATRLDIFVKMFQIRGVAWKQPIDRFETNESPWRTLSRWSQMEIMWRSAAASTREPHTRH